MHKKASMTVEAALMCPFLCLVLCWMIMVTLHLYGRVDDCALELKNRKTQGQSSSVLIRLEAVTEDLF